MLQKTKYPTEYIRACICVPKAHEQTFYDLLSSRVSGDAVTFVDFHEVLYETGISHDFVEKYNSDYPDTGLRLNTELRYDLPRELVQNIIRFIEFRTSGKIDWLVLAYAEIGGWSNFHEIEAAIEADAVLKDCAFIEQIP